MVQSVEMQAVDKLQWESEALFFEYTSAVDPHLPAIPCLLYPSALHREGPTRIIAFDLSQSLQSDGPATSPTAFAAYLRINSGESLTTEACATAQLFYVIRGTGSTQSEFGVIPWAQGDVFTLPSTGTLVHTASDESALYWVNDAPLLDYLGAKPIRQQFQPTLYTHERLMAELANVDHQPGARLRNRDAIILGNKAVEAAKSWSPTLWSAVVYVAPGEIQRPHRHNSVAIDIVMTTGKGCYTLLGEQIDADGSIVDPERVDWEPGAAFVTPPSLWHGHYNESGEPAIVMAVQDAGFYGYLRTLNIEFSRSTP